MMDFVLGWEVIVQRKVADRNVPATSRGLRSATRRVRP